MEIVDELVTPGCPNCAIKHLSAALSLCVDNPEGNQVSDVSRYEVQISRARINFFEAIEGYESHWDFAVGLLARAEEACIHGYATAEEAKAIREIRCKAMTAVTEADRLEVLRSMVAAGPADIPAHVEEALRELPDLAVKYVELVKLYDLVTVLIKLIKWVKEEFFTDFETKDNEEKGGEDMATKKVAPKAAAKKAVAKKAVAKKAVAKKGKK